MASDSDLRRRQAIAQAAVMDAAGRLAEAAGVDAPNVPARHRYPEMLPIVQMEALAAFLGVLEGKLSGNTPSDAPESPQRDESSEEAFAITKLNRDDLNTFAEAHGIDNPASYPNKPALIAAIEERLTAPDGEDA